MSNKKKSAQGLVDFVHNKLGTPYVYGAKLQYGKFTQSQLDSLAKMYPKTFTKSYIQKAKKYVGKVCTDCSGLISGYTGVLMGSATMYAKASYKSTDVKNAPIGAILYKQGHVGVKVDNTHCIEAKGINYGTVKTKISATKWTHYLLDSNIEYDTKVEINNKVNPYNEPNKTIRKGAKNDYVKWIQYELLQHGIKECKVNGIKRKLKIDGDFGSITEGCVKLFQQSCKIEVDGIVGKETRKYLKE